ncbi:MAG TPA: DMT family transporter [Xanthobacteraceae bacterium]
MTTERETAPALALGKHGYRLAPGIAAALSLGLSDVLVKVVAAAGCDVLTMLTFRSVFGMLFVAIWLHFGAKSYADARVRFTSLAIGVLFTALVFCLFEAITVIDVPTAILSYFAYPLLTGIAAALIGFEPFRWRGILCALLAFFGLAVMIGAHPAGLVLAGVGFALGAACCRTAVLLITRAWLVGADVRLTTWYSLLSSTAIFVAASLATRTWHGPQTTAGWTALLGLSLATTAGIVFLFISTVRIGPFRTALIMHLEPLTAVILSALMLGEVITPIQGVGSAIMLAALVAFQLWR